MDIQQANLNALQQRYPQLAARIQSAEQDAEVALRNTDTAYPTLVVQKHGQWAALHHPQDPVMHAQQFVQSIDGLESARNLMMFGFGLGYAALLVQQVMKEPQRILLLEPSLSVFRAALQTIDLSSLLVDPCVEIVIGGQPCAIRQAVLNHLMDFMANSVIAVEFPPVVGAFAEWAEAAKQEAQDTLRFGQSGLVTKFKDGPLTLRNLLGNLDAITTTPGLSALGESFKNVPAIIIAAGPSLAKNIDQLRGLEQHFLLIAVDTAYELLLKHGVKPHIVVTVDPTELNLRHFKQERYDDAWLLFDPEARPEIVAKFSKRLTAMTDKHDFFQWLDQQTGGKGVIRKGGMVSQAGLYAASYLGCSPIVLVGQDLALERNDGATHIAETANCRNVGFIEGEKDKADVPNLDGSQVSREPLFWVDGVDGQPVPTVQSFLIYIRMLEEDIRRIPAPVIDATEGGAKISGTKIQTLAKVIEQERKSEMNVPHKLAALGSAPVQKIKHDVRREIRDRLQQRLQSAKQIAQEVKQQTESDITRAEEQLENARQRLITDVVDDYMIEYAAPKALFEFLKLGPGGASDEVRREHIQRRLQALITAVEEANAILHESLK
ncbi:MAG: DUF115 domain-containing protein [Candidatus Hinthialibacter antarcticus]|nr:DUF115 domain-containing protein [Candidatus Hinthialibacter antarcticus]